MGLVLHRSGGTRTRLTTLFPRGGRILVVGDVMLDEYLRGVARRISPEAPVPVVEIEGRTYFPGGAANVAANIASLGGTAIIAGVVGEDDAAQRLRDELHGRHVDTSALVCEPGRATTCKARVLAGSHQIVRFDQETRNGVSENTEDLLIAAIRNAGHVDGFVMSDYAKGVLTLRLCREIIGLAQERRVPLVVDPKTSDFTRYRGATVITPNLQEAFAAAQKIGGEPVGDDDSSLHIEHVAALLRSASGASVVITRGAEGMTVAGLTETPVHIPAQSRQVFDVTGAGDTVVAALTLALAAGSTLTEAATLGNVAAGIAVGKTGTSAITREELEAALARR